MSWDVLCYIMGTAGLTGKKDPGCGRKGGESIHRQQEHKAAGSIDSCACDSKLRGWNPGLKMAVAAAALLLCVQADRLRVSSFVIFTMAGIVVLGGGLPLSRYIRLFTVPAAFLCLGTAAVAIGISPVPHDGMALSLPWFCLYVTGERLIQALLLLTKALGAVSAMYMMALTTPPGEMIGVLKRLHIPNLIIELMYLIYRFIFVLGDTHSQMKQAAQSRLGYCGFRTSCRTFGLTAGHLLLVSLKKADAYYDALLSRCYEGELCFLEEEKKVNAGQAAAAAGYLLTILLLWRIP